MSHNALFESLTFMWERRDPMPAGLPDRVLVALAVTDLDVEYELLSLTERNSQLVGARSSDDVLTFTFDAEDLSMVLRVMRTGTNTVRVDGWISPPRQMTVTATQSGESLEAQVVDAGRFEFPELKSGATRFLLHPDPEFAHRITPSVDL